MKWKDLGKYLSLFILAVAVIIVYKTFDNFSIILDLTAKIFRLLTPFFIGFAIAYILFPACRKFEELFQRTKANFLVKYRRGLAVSSIFIIFIGVVALILVAILPALISSISDFVEQLPSLIESFLKWVNSFDIVQINDSSWKGLLNNKYFSVQSLIDNIDFGNVNKYAQGVMNVGTAMFNVFMGIVISVYILLDRETLKSVFLRVTKLYVGDKTRHVVGRYVHQINEFIQKYISCMLVDACIIFILSFIALMLMKVKYAPVLALMVGLFNMIPYFGAITATLLSGLITMFTGSPLLGVIVVVVLIVLQQVDANIIQPKLLSGSLNVKPFWVIFGILLGGGLFGILGIFLAVPIIALLRIILLDVMDLREKKKKDKAESPPPEESK